ncbi:MAG: hypothetical protein AB7R69_01695 [Candidatus Babeliales bacterium]
MKIIKYSMIGLALITTQLFGAEQKKELSATLTIKNETNKNFEVTLSDKIFPLNPGKIARGIDFPLSKLMANKYAIFAATLTPLNAPKNSKEKYELTLLVSDLGTDFSAKAYLSSSQSQQEISIERIYKNKKDYEEQGVHGKYHVAVTLKAPELTLEP